MQDVVVRGRIKGNAVATHTATGGDIAQDVVAREIQKLHTDVSIPNGGDIVQAVVRRRTNVNAIAGIPTGSNIVQTIYLKKT